MIRSLVTTDKSQNYSSHCLFSIAAPEGKSGSVDTKCSAMFPACDKLCQQFATMLKAQWVCWEKSPEKIKRIFLIELRDQQSWKIGRKFFIIYKLRTEFLLHFDDSKHLTLKVCILPFTSMYKTPLVDRLDRPKLPATIFSSVATLEPTSWSEIWYLWPEKY